MSPAETELIQRHRKELKDFHVKASSMKKAVPISDKKRRKEILAEIDRLEKEIRDRQDEELRQAQSFGSTDSNENSEVQNITESLNHIDLGPNSEQVQAEPLLPEENDQDNDDQEESQEEPENGGKKLTRAQRRRLNKQTKLNAARAQEPKVDASKSVTMSARTTERIKLKKILDENGYRLLDMPSDGNCLFSSLCHQLILNGIQQSVSSLRAETARFMREHPDDFKPFLVHHESGDSFTEEDFVKYCHELEKTNAWGSQIELRAISRILGWPIRVLQAEGPEVLIGEEYNSCDKIPLTIVYLRHELCLGEHYNSVMPK